jgi:hypothetical protein
MPMVHPCGRQDCGVLTMGEFCVDHERRPDAPGRRLQRVITASALAAVALVGAAIQLRVR